MTSTETTESTETEAPSKKAVRLDQLPDSVLHPAPTAVKTIALGPVFAQKVAETNDLLDKFQEIRDAYEASQKALESSDHPLAVEYRKISAAVNETVRALENDSDEAKEIARLKQVISEKVNSAREVQKAKRNEAQAQVTGTMVSELNPEALSQQLTDNNTVLTTMKKVLSDENPDLSKWSVIDPARAQGKKGSRKSKTGTRRPRLAYAFIDNSPVEPSGKYVTSTDVAKKLGVTDVGNLNTLMFQAVGNPDQIPATEFHFNVTVNKVEHSIRVCGRTAEKDEAEAAA